MEKETIEELEVIRKEFNEIEDGNLNRNLKIMNTMEDTFKMPWLLKHNSRELPEEVFSLHQEINDSRIY